jgi:DNA-directed RNA polymerase specialized sigma24 family protein
MTDGQLPECFVGRRDATAFAALAQRHAPMVWGTCRRILRNHHEAEDAFQATFLVRARKAASVTPKEIVAGWLFGIARQTALKARGRVVRNGSRDRQVVEIPDRTMPDQDGWHDPQPLLDEELSRLPDGAVHFISDVVSPEDLRAFISKDTTEAFSITGIPYRYE